MWALFTKALSRSPSTTQVSILNTSSNFMLTAFLGLLIFSESLPPMWWVGASLLVAGNVIIGRRDEKEAPLPSDDEHRAAESGQGMFRDGSGTDETEALLAEDIELEEDAEDAAMLRRRAEMDERDILDLDLAPEEVTAARM
jgi:hypothetical protein